MPRRTLVLLCGLALCLGAVSCEKIDRREPVRGELEFQEVQFADAIPAEYGKLVGVTSLPANPYNVTLWFVKADETIVALQVNIASGTMSPRALTIPRK